MTDEGIAYLRYSDDRTKEEVGVTSHLASITELAKKDGVTIVRVFKDNDETATAKRRTKPRPDYTAMVAYIEAGGAGSRNLYAWDPDRLYREMRDLEDLVDLVERHRLNVRTVNAGIVDLSTSNGRLQARIRGSVAKHEGELKGERIANRKLEHAIAGLPSGGKRPFGYEADGMTVRADEAAVIRSAAQAILAGASLAAAAREATGALGRPVTVRTLRRALTKHRVIGYRIHQPMTDRRQAEPPPPSIHKAAWPAILDEATWRQVRVLLEDPARSTHRPARFYLLTGILECGKCGRPLTGSGTSYRCHKLTGCGGLSVQMKGADEVAGDWARLVVAEWREKLTARRTETLNADTAGADANTVEALVEHGKTLAALFAAQEMTLEEYRAAKAVHQQRLQAAQAVAATHARQAVLDRQVLEADTDWDELSLDTKRAVLRWALDLDGLRMVAAPAKNSAPRFDPNRISIAPAK